MATDDVAAVRRSSYAGPIEVGMVMVGVGNEGEPFRRDLVLGFHPFKEGMVIYEALPCKMRKRIGSGVGEISLCPEVNMRYVMRPETDPAEDPSAEPGAFHAGPVDFYGDRSNGYIRIFGVGLWWKDRSRRRLYFSERNWISPFHFAIGTWHFKFMGRSRVAEARRA